MLSFRKLDEYKCVAVIDLVRVLDAIDDDRYRLALELLGRVVAMLTRLCR
jgi:hypothetical protein